MKIAVITDSLIGFEFVSYLNSLEAEVVLFTKSPIEEGHFFLNHQHIKVFNQDILWVHKKALSAQDIVGSARMKDEFRIVYEVQPSIENDQQHNSELSASLSKPLDFYVDVDGLVVLHSEKLPSCNAHPSGAPALGELKLKNSPQVFYEALAEDMQLPLEGEVAIIGHSLTSQQSIKKIFSWLLDSKLKNKRVFWITHKSNPWDEVHAENFRIIQQQLDFHFQQEVEKFLRTNKEWQGLEDYVKVKISKPEEPIPSLVIFAAHYVSSMDTHINSKKLYITLERTPFNSPSIQLENTTKEMKTLSVDQLYIFNGHVDSLVHKGAHFLTANEPGYLTYAIPQLTLKDIIEDFEKRFLPYFRKV